MDITIARVIHVLSIVIWIGGVSMVTTVILPAIKKMKTVEEQLKTFSQIEGKFSIQARITTLLTGISGFYMLYRLDAWNRYLDYHYWWLHAMTIVWLIFTIILFILEPFVVKKRLKKLVSKNPGKAFSMIQRMHWILLTLSLLTIFGAVAGSHGWFFFK